MNRMNTTSRRPWLAYITVVLVLFAVAALALPGIAYVTSSLRAVDRRWAYLANVSELPVDGTPRYLTAIATRRDAWSRRYDRSSTVWVRREPQTGKVIAFLPVVGNGLGVRYDAHDKMFRTTCWGGIPFDLAGNEMAGNDMTVIGALVPVPLRVVDDEIYMAMDGD
jgi:hypothetical protein